MSFASATLRQHIVEFVSGTGIVTDGVVDSTSPSGPWTWTVPSGVCLLKVDGISGGSGGGAGYSIGTALAGGGGGRGGGGIMGMDLTVIPNAVLTITIGSGGTGGVAGVTGPTGGGRSSISGLTRPYLWRRYATASDTIEFQAGFSGVGGTGQATFAGDGGSAGNGAAGRSTGTTNAVSPAAASNIGNYMQASDSGLTTGANWQYGGRAVCQGGAGGGGASTVTTTAGANGGGGGAGGSIYNVGRFGTFISGGSGNQSGGISRGGGGVGGNSFLAWGGAGGTLGGPGGNGGLGAGGGGGAGGANGGNGGNGYIRFTYWRMD